MVFNLSEQNSIANRFIAEIRDGRIQQDPLRFRRNMERIGEVLAYEVSKTLEYETLEVETPLGIATTSVPKQKIILGTILRAGLPIHQGLLNYFDRAGNAFVSAYRVHHKDGTFEIKMEFVSCPDLTACVLILADAMIATGASIDLAIRELKNFGRPAHIHIVSAIAATPGISQIKRFHPEARIWAGAVDSELTARSFIVPGLGDAGDLSYGQKIQE